MYNKKSYNRVVRTLRRGAGNLAGAYGTAKAYSGPRRSHPRDWLKRSSAPQSSIAPTGITSFQKDYKTVYTKKRAPRKVRKRASRKRKQFLGQQLRLLGSKKFHYHGSMFWNTVQGSQNFFGFLTYDMAGTGGVDGSGDVRDVLTRMGASDEAAAGTWQSSRYYFDTMSARCSLTNVGSTGVYLEMYTMICRQDIPLFEIDAVLAGTAQSPTIPTMGAILTYAQGQQGQLPAGTGALADTRTSTATSPSTSADGVTPFQFRWLCSRFKIVKVQRFQVNPGNPISFSMQDTKNRSIIYDEQVRGNICRKGWTKMYLFRQWGVTDNTAGDPEPAPTQVTIDIEKDYVVKKLVSNANTLSYMNYTNHLQP